MNELSGLFGISIWYFASERTAMDVLAVIRSKITSVQNLTLGIESVCGRGILWTVWAGTDIADALETLVRLADGKVVALHRQELPYNVDDVLSMLKNYAAQAQAKLILSSFSWPVREIVFREKKEAHG